MIGQGNSGLSRIVGINNGSVISTGGPDHIFRHSTYGSLMAGHGIQGKMCFPDSGSIYPVRYKIIPLKLSDIRIIESIHRGHGGNRDPCHSYFDNRIENRAVVLQLYTGVLGSGSGGWLFRAVLLFAEIEEFNGQFVSLPLIKK